MTAGIGVPGFLGYAVGDEVPNLTQILYGAPPANSPPITVIAEPGNVYRYSGGSYEVAETLMVDTMGASFPDLMKEAVLDPAGMSRSSFATTLPADLDREAMRGHLTDGSEIPGGYHVFPEHAAAGLWSTPTDLANLLILIGRAWRGESQLFLAPQTVREMLTPQNGAPYGLGAAIGEADGVLVVMKRGQNVGFQSYLILLPAEGKGMVVMTNSDNGSILAEALIRRAGELFGWPALASGLSGRRGGRLHLRASGFRHWPRLRWGLARIAEYGSPEVIDVRMVPRRPVRRAVRFCHHPFPRSREDISRRRARRRRDHP